MCYLICLGVGRIKHAPKQCYYLVIKLDKLRASSTQQHNILTYAKAYVIEQKHQY